MAEKKNKPTPKKPALTTHWWENDRLFPWLPLGVYFVLVIIHFAEFVFSDNMLAGSDTLQAGHVSLPNGLGLTYPDPVGDVALHGVPPNELTASEHRDWLAGTPWHKHVPARIEPA